MIEHTYLAARTAAQKSASPQTVLLVEDDTLVAMVVEENLRGLGFEPVIACDAASASAALEQGLNPTLAVIDVGLPDERGDQLARRFRSTYPMLKVIIASGYDEHELKARFADDTSIRILGKPYTEGDLANAVRSLGLDEASR